jgi:hypothetical protein
MSKAKVLGWTGLLLVACVVAERAAAEPSREPEQPSKPSQRQAVVIGIAGDVDAPARASLHRLLEAQLPALGFYLATSEPDDTLAGWVEDVTRRPHALLGVLLDARNPESWRLIVIDALRRRAVARDLPGGAGNAANVEAAVSVVLSAASALRDGLEVASAPVDSVVPETSPAPSSSDGGGDTSSAPPIADTRQRDAADVTGPSRGRADALVLRGALGMKVASFSADARPGFGAAAAVGLTLPASIDVRLDATHYFPVTYTSALGDFDVAHISASITAGPRLHWGNWALMVQAGFIAERLLRSNPRGGAAVSPTDDFSLTRFGAAAALRASYAVFDSLAVQAGAGGTYYGRPVFFVARSAGSLASAESDADRFELARLWPAAIFAELAVEVASD